MLASLHDQIDASFPVVIAIVLFETKKINNRKVSEYVEIFKVLVDMESNSHGNKQLIDTTESTTNRIRNQNLSFDSETYAIFDIIDKRATELQIGVYVFRFLHIFIHIDIFR